jgi:uncharacterized protein (TIGR00251 family)
VHDPAACTGTPLRRDGRDGLLEVRVTPRASRTGFNGVANGRLRIRLQAPPVDGRANTALVEFVASSCALPRARVTLERGAGSRDKTLRLHGLQSMPVALRDAFDACPSCCSAFNGAATPPPDAGL